MALNYLTGRVSRLGVGVPGFSTDRELVLDVAGALGIGTTLPRAEADVPNISIREQIIDSSGEEGPIGYFLSADVEGVRWIQGNPGALSRIRLYDNGVQVGFSDFTGLNFSAPDDDFIKITPNALGDPEIADIKFDIRWIKTQFGDNFGIATGFGTDGTYASIPGFGTSEAVGVTSVGIGTNQPQDDFQVGIGSTGVTINGPEGRLEAVTIAAQNIEVDGNITVESLVVDPGIATFRGNIDAQGISSFTGDVLIGFASITDSQLEQTRIGLATVGFATIGVGATTDPALFVNGISTFAGLVTTFGDLYVGNDLYVGGEQFIEQLNANNVQVTGIATINQTEITGAAITDLRVSGFSTLGDFSANSGVVTFLSAEDIVGGAATVGFASIGEAEIGIVTIGIATVGEVDIGFASVTNADVGVLTAGSAEVGIDSEGSGLVVNGISTFTGFATFLGDVAVGGDLDVGGDLSFENLFGQNLVISGIATINVGIFTDIRSEILSVSGVSTLAEVLAGVTTSNFINAGVTTSSFLGVGTGNIGILTGDLLNYTVGVIDDLASDTAFISTLTGNNLSFVDNSFINGVSFGQTLVTVSQNLEVLGITTFRGVGTFGTDLYVGNDLFVGGEQFIEQLNATNLSVSGIATINALEFAVGFGTTAIIAELTGGIGTIGTFFAGVGTISDFTADRLAVIDPADPLPPQFTLPPPIGNAYISEVTTNELRVARNGTVGILDVLSNTNTFTLNVAANGFINNLRFTSGVGTDLELETLRVGVVTIGEVDIGFASVTNADVGVATIGDLTVTGVSTFEGLVEFEELVLINETITGVASINQLEYNVGIGTSALIERAQIGVATVGLLSATDIEAVDLEVSTSRTGIATVGFASVGVDTTSPALYVVGVNTFIGFTTFTGDVFIDGDLTVNGITTFAQLDAEQAQIGILTVFQRLDSQGQADFEAVSIAGSFVASGLSTIGLSTFTPDGDVQINRNLIVGGATTFIGQVNIEDTAFINLEVTDTAFINNLFVNVGIATTMSVGDFDANVGVVTSLTVTGASTFIGVGTFQNDLYVSEDLYVEDTIFTTNEVVTGLSSVAFSDIGIATVGFATVKEAFVGVLTTGTLTIETLDVLGVSTFRGDVFMQEDLDVAGITSTGDLDVVGVASIGIASIRTAFIDFLNWETAVGAAASIEYLTVGVSSDAFSPALNVAGVSTFAGLTTFIGDVFIDGDLSITGLSSFTAIGADFGLIGILTVSNYLDVNDLEVTGFTTLTDYEFRVGVGSTLNVVDANVSGILSTGNLFIAEDLEVGRNLVVNGISTLGSSDPVTGFTTTLGDLYVGGDLFVLDDIFYDEIVGRNLFISGIATINQLEYAVGLGTTTITNELRFNVGFGTSLAVDNLNVGVVTVGLVTAGDVIVGGALTVVGETTLNDLVTINDNLIVDGNVHVSGAVTASIGIFTDISVNTGFVTSLNVENVQAGVVTATGISAGVGTFNLVRTFAVDASSGIVTAGQVDVLGDINAGGIGSFAALNVDGNAVIGGATSLGDLRATGDVIIDGNLSVAGDTTLSNVSITTATVAVAGVNTLTVNNTFFSTGISTFAAGLTVDGLAQFTGFLTATAGIITTLSGTDLQYENITATTQLNAEQAAINGSLSVGTTVTSTDLQVNNFANMQFVNAGILTAFDLDVTNQAYIENLSFNQGIGTNLVLETATIDNVAIGTITIDDADVQLAQVGILTITQQLDHEFDATSTTASRAATTDANPTTLFTVPPGYTSAEFTVTGVQGTDFISSKIHALNAGANVFFNEYSFLSSGPDYALFEVIPAAGAMILQVTVANGIPAQFTIHSVAHKA